MLVLELWGLGDVALAIPFLRTASQHSEVRLLAKAHAEPVLRRFAPDVKLIPFDAPWTAFSGKYRLTRWPWRTLRSTCAQLRGMHFDLGVSVRPDPRDHLLLTVAGVQRRLGFARLGSQVLLQTPLPRPSHPHRADAWRAVAAELGWNLTEAADRPSGPVRRIVVHTGAAQPVRRWPEERYRVLSERLRARGVEVDVVENDVGSVDQLLERLAAADAFIGNDSGPGHLAALLSRPTFTVFGPQLPEKFAPVHPQAAWVPGIACPHKPCFDACRFSRPHCLLDLELEEVWSHVAAWLDGLR